MFPAARFLLQLSLSMSPVINRHFRSGRLSELYESVAVPLNPADNNRIDDRSCRPPSIPSPRSSDLNPEILDWIRKLDPAELERIYAILDKIQQFDPAEILELCLKEKDKKEEEKRRETEKENEKERESESSGIGGEYQNGGEVENEVVEKSSTRNQYPFRLEAGDCWWYLKTGNCKFGSNCKYNHPRRRKNKQKVSKGKAQQREEFAGKQDPAEDKKKVSKNKVKQREDLAEYQDQTESKVCNCIDDQSDHPLFIQSPLPSNLNPEILEWIQGLDPTELDRTYAIFDQFQQFDPAFENWNFNPSIVDEIWELSLKEREKKKEEEKEIESEKENEMEREGESSGIGGWNQNGGEVEKEVVAESNRRNQYPLRPKPGDCSLYLKTGSCKFGSNCKFNHPRGRKNKQKLYKGKAKQREELAEKQDQTKSKYFPGRRKGEHSVAPALELNFMGLPIRPGKKDCWHYMRDGACKYENSCLYNHPDPTPAEESRPQSAYESGGIHSETTEWNDVITPSWD